MKQVKTQNVVNNAPPTLPVIQGNWFEGQWRITPQGPKRREYVVGCWVKCNVGATRPCNFAVTDHDQSDYGGYAALRSYFGDESTYMSVRCDNYYSGHQKTLDVDIPYISDMGGYDTHWVHLMTRVQATGGTADWFVNGLYKGTNTYTLCPTYTTEPYGYNQSIFGRRYGGGQQENTSFIGSVYNWFCADDEDYRSKFGFSYDIPEDYVTPWVRNNGGNMLVPVTDDDMPSRVDAMANMYLGCHATAGPSGVINVNGFSGGQTWFSNQNWSMNGKIATEMPVFGYDMRT